MSLPNFAHLSVPVSAPMLDLAMQDAAPQDAAQELAQPPAGTTGGEAPPSGWNPFGGMMIPMLAIFAIFYFVMIGPERKARKKREAMLAQMKKGDAVVTSSGLHGTIAALADDVITLQVDEGVRLRFSRAAIQSVLPKDA
jgi:preprotein translocase subunit YajC